MSRRDRGRSSARTERVRALLAGGDHGGARVAARALLADGDATEAERVAAREALEGLAPDRGAVAAGVAGVLAAIAVALWTVARG